MSPPKEFLDIFEFPNIDEFYNSCVKNEECPLWIFAYGSLLWFPNFNFDLRVLGYVNNVQRTMTQASFRLGTENWPGRVATLIPYLGERTWGAAYKITNQEQKEVAYERMEKREIEQGYDLAICDFIPQDSSDHIKSVVYIALPNIPTSLVDVPLEIQAYQILLAKGVGGENKIYLYKLENSLKSEILSTIPEAFDESKDIIITLAQFAHEFENETREIAENQKHLIKPILFGNAHSNCEK